MKHFLLALQFLTIFTLKSDLRCEAQDFLKARLWYGPVGLLLGLIMAALAWLGQGILPALPLAACLVLVWAGLTRCLHLDGLGDTADALIGTADRQRAFEIMKDSRIGAFALVAVTGLLLLKFSSLSVLTEPFCTLALVSAPLWGRVMALGLSLQLPPARNDGLGAMTTGRDRSGWGGLALGLTLALGISFVGAGLKAAFFMAASQALLFMLLAIWFKRRLAGINGDTLGASIELSETVVLLVWVAISLKS